ncbi:sulfatase [Orenia marismortui]|uniref:Arylsulfatase A-like enzyme n=1 Tax=Orenia marismortui TaxID=46469 RepID=A0A4R8HHM5_9FIRM|nr:sulfatase [Orenia marismortui]TDX58908.1 arylsulfatase A-like enzyme [Orenia marismortui]
MNYLLLSVDTLRYDAISKYLTPNIYGLLEGSVQFTNCYSQAPCTIPSFASALTGLYPHEHGLNQKENTALPEEISYLPEVMKERGYKTVCLQGNSQLDNSFKFNRGFDIYMCQELCRKSENGGLAFPSAESISVHTRSLLDQLNSDFFIWANFIDPHCPYDSPPYYEMLDLDLLPYTNDLHEASQYRPEFFNLKQNKKIKLSELERKYLYSRYMAGVRRVDQAIGEIMHHLENSDLLDETVVIFFADHGEEFWDHGDDRNSEDPYYRGVDHGHTLYNEQIHVPLAYKLPQNKGEKVDSLVELRSLYRVLTETNCNSDEIIKVSKSKEAFAEHLLYGDERKSYINKDLIKTIYNTEDGKIEAYDLKKDPKEINKLESIEESLKEKIKEFTKAGSFNNETEEAEISDEVEERLRALGYLD